MSTTTTTTRLNARQCQKRGSWSDWEKATNFVPLRGEIIVYEADDTHPVPKFKVGIWDGKESTLTSAMYINNLPFASDPDAISVDEIEALF